MTCPGVDGAIRVFSTAWTPGPPNARGRSSSVGATRRNGGRAVVNWRLRDWGVSRQRYWGCPVPIIHCPVVRRGAGARGRSASGAARGRDASTCPAIRWTTIRPGSMSPAPGMWRPRLTRETDTLRYLRRQLAGTFARFCQPPRSERPVATRTAVAMHWLPVDQYIGGVEHAILHLLYSRGSSSARCMTHRPAGTVRGAVRRPVHPGDGDARELSRRRGTVALPRGRPCAGQRTVLPPSGDTGDAGRRSAG